MKQFLIIILTICSIQIAYAQLPMKKDSVIGTKQMKKLMVENGFNFYKQEVHPKNGNLNKSLEVFYKEEVRLNIWYNDFNNIENIAIYTGNESFVDEIKNVVEYDKWIFSHTEKDFLHTNRIYKINNSSAQFVYKPDYIDDPSVKHIVFQFLIYN